MSTRWRSGSYPIPMSRARNSGSSSSTGPQSSTESSSARRVGILLVDAVEELLGLGREQRDLLLLDEDRQRRALPLRAWITNVRAPGDAERAGTDGVDGVELDVIGHVISSFGSGGSGSRSVRPPVSLHFTSMQPYAWKSNTVADAGDTCTRWNRSRCMPV